MVFCWCCFFFFKQKTAYEIVSGDWSSDVCSSDLDGARRGQLQHPEDGIETVLSHVAEGAGAEVIPAAPDEGKVNVVKRTRGRRAKPQVPVESGRNWVRLFGPLDSLRPEGPAGPVLHPAHRSDSAGRVRFALQPRRLRGRVAHGHLRRD